MQRVNGGGLFWNGPTFVNEWVTMQEVFWDDHEEEMLRVEDSLSECDCQQRRFKAQRTGFWTESNTSSNGEAAAAVQTMPPAMMMMRSLQIYFCKHFFEKVT